MSSRIVSFQRFLSERKRGRRRRLGAEPLVEWADSGPSRMPSDRQLAHRKRMLDHLRRHER